MFDIFYFDKKPNLFAHEQKANNFLDAQQKSKTRFFWVVNYLCNYNDFDFLWEPKPWEAEHRHAFPSQHQKASGTYLCPTAGWRETNYHDDTVVHVNETLENWVMKNEIEIDDWDWSWHPDPTEPPYVYVFGTQWQKTGGPVYTVPGASDRKYVDSPRVNKTSVDEYWDDTSFTNFDYTWHPDETEPPYIYQFGTQWQKTGGPRYTVPGANIVKYVKENRITKTSVDPNWEEGTVEMEGFDYTWHPDETEPPYIYEFGTAHAKTGGPKYIVPGADTVKYVTQSKIKNISISKEVYLIDHGNPETNTVVEQLEKKGMTIKKRARFIASYKGTLERILSREESDFVWVCSSVCDYSEFDFSWYPEQWQGTMLHVFASEDQKFGDTFLINVPSFNTRIKQTEILEWYDTIHFVDNIDVPRWEIPTMIVDGNSIVEPVRAHVFKEPLALFTNNPTTQNTKIPAVNLWREKTRAITPLNSGNSTVIVPRDAKTHLLKEMYDYPFIDTTYSNTLSDKPLDVVFISNGEENADKNWKHLQRCLTGKTNRRVRVDGVNGRAQAYRAAAEASDTPWFFAVFAKLKVDKNFDWDWQPDRMQVDKHYIFHAQNPVNGLVYGHMAMIAYHKQLTLDTNPTGLDFTLDAEHEVVPILSGIAEYASDVWTAWRSALREVIKLQDAMVKTPDVETEFRLHAWLNKGEGAIGQWSKQGAADAIEYYTSVDGNFDKLRLTYEWKWLHDYFVKKYGIEPAQLQTQLQNQLAQGI